MILVYLGVVELLLNGIKVFAPLLNAPQCQLDDRVDEMELNKLNTMLYITQHK